MYCTEMVKADLVLLDRVHDLAEVPVPVAALDLPYRSLQRLYGAHGRAKVRQVVEKYFLAVRHSWLLGRVGLPEQLFRDLAKVVNETDSGVSLQRIRNAEDVDVALVEEWMKNVDGLDCSGTLKNHQFAYTGGILSSIQNNG